MRAPPMNSRYEADVRHLCCIVLCHLRIYWFVAIWRGRLLTMISSRTRTSRAGLCTIVWSATYIVTVSGRMLVCDFVQHTTILMRVLYDCLSTLCLTYFECVVCALWSHDI